MLFLLVLLWWLLLLLLLLVLLVLVLLLFGLVVVVGVVQDSTALYNTLHYTTYCEVEYSQTQKHANIID